MTSLVLGLVVMTSSGGLLAERTPTPGMLMGAAVADADVQTMSLSELTAERVRLNESIPGPGLGIGLTVGGGALLLTGTVILAAALTVEVAVVGLLMMVASIPLFIIGPILIGSAVRERRHHTNRLRAVDARIKQMQNDSAIPPPSGGGGDEVPPPPPPRPPGVDLGPAAEPSLLLATF